MIVGQKRVHFVGKDELVELSRWCVGATCPTVTQIGVDFRIDGLRPSTQFPPFDRMSGPEGL